MYTPSVLRLLASSFVAAMAVQASGIMPAALGAGALVLAAAPVLAAPVENLADGLEARGDIVPDSGSSDGTHCCGGEAAEAE